MKLEVLLNILSGKINKFYNPLLIINKNLLAQYLEYDYIWFAGKYIYFSEKNSCYFIKLKNSVFPIFISEEAVDDEIIIREAITQEEKKYFENCIDEAIKTKFKKIIKIEKNETFDFGKAIKLLKEGKKLKRKGWNGKNQYIELAKHTSYTTINNEIRGGLHREINNLVIIFRGTSGIQVGWLASQADILAEDWIIYKEGSEENEEGN